VSGEGTCISINFPKRDELSFLRAQEERWRSDGFGSDGFGP
jgi:hypothetical protein